MRQSGELKEAIRYAKACQNSYEPKTEQYLVGAVIQTVLEWVLQSDGCRIRAFDKLLSEFKKENP